MSNFTVLFEENCLGFSPVSLWFTFLEWDFPFWSPFAAHTGSSAGPRHPQRLQALRRLLIGELHLLTLFQAPETLHHQFTLLERCLEKQNKYKFCIYGPIFHDVQEKKSSI